MCLTPIFIKNPNYGLHFDPKTGRFPYNRYKDTKSTRIAVPCGKCPECLHSRQMSYIERSQLQSFNSYLFFCTLTYNPSSLPVLSLTSPTDGKLYELPFADTKDIQLFFKRIRNYKLFGDRNFKYIAVSEFGSRKHRPHWHVIFFVDKLSSDSVYTPINLEFHLYPRVLECWSRNVGSRKFPKYVPLLTLPSRPSSSGRSPYDFHYVQIRNGSCDDVAFYVTKYCLKIDSFTEKRFNAIKLNYPSSDADYIWSIVKPKFFISKGFGSLDTPEKYFHVLNGLNKSIDFPVFVNPSTGQTFPLAKYLRKFLRWDDVVKYSHFLERCPDGTIITQPRLNSPSKISTSYAQLSKQIRQINSHGLDD